ncbi:DUF2167 domain-containing protein [Robbsia sp. KACC 23696]|uniref:DUF2167 domain-containing protein n=1 Tax=Robbsia sp. KACC 23696 TaxID=3149231 RepID=UPI00325ABB04
MKVSTNITFCFLIGLFAAPVFAQSEAIKAENKAAVAAAEAATQKGPRDIAIFDEATLSLPADDVFIPAAGAARVFKSMGQTLDEKRFVGVVASARDDSHWFALINFVRDGYVRDGDAQDWKADDLLRRLTDGTKQSNPSRKAHGAPALDVLGWAEPPTYDSKAHKLVWAVIAQRDDQPDDQAHHVVNYQTVALGRDGHLDLTIGSNLADLEADKSIATSLLQRVAFLPGKRYDDFNKLTDKVAAYGLAALVVGVAAKKLGLLALLLAFLVKFAKLAAPIGVLVMWIKKKFRRSRAGGSGGIDMR